uniref:Hypotheticial protein n=1 Tax=Schistosoma japonicum TaxID=6182 RepID=C1LSP6_SCHJA|nr:hypotheticial protein [Schistosoma japonicum]
MAYTTCIFLLAAFALSELLLCSRKYRLCLRKK